MYIPKIYKEEDLNKIVEFIQAFPFGIICGAIDNEIKASHLPFQLRKTEDQIYLKAHISKANPLWDFFKTNNELLVIFQGPHSYISSSWYTSENVPTWNYIAAHTYGNSRIVEGEELKKDLSDLIDDYESKTKTYLKMDDLNPELVKKELRGIVGVEITITRIEASFKLSQNRDEQSFSNIISALTHSADQNERMIAAAMSKINQS